MKHILTALLLINPIAYASSPNIVSVGPTWKYNHQCTEKTYSDKNEEIYVVDNIEASIVSDIFKLRFHTASVICSQFKNTDGTTNYFQYSARELLPKEFFVLSTKPVSGGLLDKINNNKVAQVTLTNFGPADGRQYESVGEVKVGLDQLLNKKELDYLNKGETLQKGFYIQKCLNKLSKCWPAYYTVINLKK